MIRIMLADDHALFREPLKRLVEEQDDMTVVGEASTASEILPLARRSLPDLVLLDVRMPGRGCVEVVQELRQWRPHLRVLIVTGEPDRSYAVRLFRAGIDGYITKDEEPAKLLDACRQVARGRKYVPGDLLEAITDALSRDSDRPRHEDLSPREYEVFMHLAQAKTVSEIGEMLNLSVKTISTYRTRILEKLDLRNNAEIMRYALQHKLISFPDEGEEWEEATDTGEVAEGEEAGETEEVGENE